MSHFPLMCLKDQVIDRKIDRNFKNLKEKFTRLYKKSLESSCRIHIHRKEYSFSAKNQKEAREKGKQKKCKKTHGAAREAATRIGTRS